MTNASELQSRNNALDSIRKAMIEKKITQAGLADLADCHEKTIQNLMAGRTVRDQTLFDVCMVLDLEFEEIKSEWSGSGPPGKPQRDEPGQPGATTEIAPIYMGGYTRPAVEHLIGRYLTIRPSFTKDGVIFAFQTDVSWDESWPSLIFEECNRPDAPYSHRGRVHVPTSSPFIHFVSLTKGAMRMILLPQPDQTDSMRGLITTLSRQGAAITPVSSPIIYRRISDEAVPEYGEILSENTAFAEYRSLLDECIAAGHVSLINM